MRTIEWDYACGHKYDMEIAKKEKASGSGKFGYYGNNVVTPYRVKINNRWHRVYQSRERRGDFGMPKIETFVKVQGEKMSIIDPSLLNKY